MRKLCIILSSSLKTYFEKGEIKPRYYNPCSIFKEIHVISLNDEEIEEEKVRKAFGDAKLFIHPVGTPRIFNILSFRKKIIEKIKAIGEVDVLRSFNHILASYFVVYAGRKLNIPTVHSIHTNFDLDVRYYFWRRKKYLQFFKYYLTSKTIEPYILSNASAIVCKYQSPVKYALKYGAKKENIHIIYNWVYTSKFHIKPKKKNIKFLKILCVGRLIEEKNQKVLIMAIKGLDVKLTLIGDGEMYSDLVKMVQDLKLEDRVKFIKSVPHKDITYFYEEADIFAIPIKCSGISIPVMEAMASGLPIVVPKPYFEPEPELVGKIAYIVENTPEGFRHAFLKLMENREMREEMGKKGREFMEKMDGELMERKEMELYKTILRENKDEDRIRKVST